nr:basic salivary proline-rich protein 2-like [Globicephala melas]
MNAPTGTPPFSQEQLARGEHDSSWTRYSASQRRDSLARTPGGEKRAWSPALTLEVGANPVRTEGGGSHKRPRPPNRAGRTLPMAEFLPLLPCAPLLTQDGGAQDSPVPPAKWQSQQPQGGRAQGLVSKPWRLPGVPSIQITPASDGESPPCTPPPQRLQLPRTPDPETLPQDRSDLGGGVSDSI